MEGNGNGSQPTMSGVTIPRGRYDQLAQYAKQEGTTVEALVDEALTEFLRQPENGV